MSLSKIVVLSSFLILSFFMNFVSCHIEEISLNSEMSCNGMYSKKDIPLASSNSTITVEFQSFKPPVEFSIVIYNVKDEPSLLASEGKLKVCGAADTISKGICKEEDKGKFVLKEGEKLSSPIINELRKADTSNATLEKIVYIVQETGYYCLAVLPLRISLNGSEEFKGIVTYVNPFGLIPAIDYPKLPFYGFVWLFYFAVGAVWAYKAYLNWNDLLHLQLIITGIIGFLIVEHGFIFGYYDSFNRNGASSTFLLVIVAIMNAARNSVSFFLLLIVCLGYGVVKPSLGSTMKKCILLAVVHFVFGVIYMIGSMVSRDINSATILIFVFPLSATMTIFYYWTLQALDDTKQHLEERRQVVKLTMYKRLWMLLLFCIMSILGLFVINSVFFSKRNSPDWLPSHWKWNWLLADASLNLLYLIAFTTIVALWRPTENNRRYGLDELAQDDIDEHELDVVNGIGGQHLSQNISKRTHGNFSDYEGEEIFALDEPYESMHSPKSRSPDDEEVLQWAQDKFGIADDEDIEEEEIALNS